MLNGRFQILLRRRQNQAELPAGSGIIVNAIVQCNGSTGYAEYIAGTVDNVTPWVDITPVAGWYDFTNYIEDAEKISFTWDKVNSGDSSNTATNQDGSNYDKGITADLMFFDKAWAFINDWLLSTECSILNSVEVRIIDLIARGLQPDPAGNYRIFEIKSDNIDYAPIDEPCQFHIKLREQDNNWHCIHKTFIWDDWQGWFKSGGKDHPCFLTCIEPRPRLVQSARMALSLFFHSLPASVIIDWITGAPSATEEARKIFNANRFVDAPLVRTYIENVAGKCGLQMDTIFDQGKPWENLCLYYPQAGYMHESDDDAVASPSLAYHFDNRWLITIAELLDKLKVVFAAEWYVTPLNTIVFKHKIDLISILPIYDFTLPTSEPIYNLRYTFNGDKKPAYGRYEYQDDGSDLASQEMSTLYSDIIDYDGPSNNPMLEGERTKNFEFAPTGFIRDGRSKDYMKLLINDGKLGASILVIVVFLIGFFFIPSISFYVGLLLVGLALEWAGIIQLKGTALRKEFVTGPNYDGAVRLTSEQTLVPRLILWDGLHMQQAKAVFELTLPTPNAYYNPLNTPYNVKNRIDQDNPGQHVYNYPLYFDGDFMDNLFPKYHDNIDNPLKSLETHQDVKWSVDLCEGMLNLFGVFENQYAQIGKVVKLETRDNYDVYVRIGNISVDYDNNQINLRGVVIRRQLVTEQRGEPTSYTPTESSGSVIQPPERPDVCLRWENKGTETAVGVVYRDCDALLVETDIPVGGLFCAIEILSLGTGGSIQATASCETGESPSGSGEESGSGAGCGTYQNVGTDNACIDYIDCNGDLHEDAIISLFSTFCARSIVRVSAGITIIRVGGCSDPSCVECCDPTGASAEVVTEEELGLRLIFDDIGNAPVVDPSSVSDWNTYFDMGVEADTPFDSVIVAGNEVTLFGGTNVNIKTDLFYPGEFVPDNTSLIGIIDDDGGIVTSVGQQAFRQCVALTTVTLPGCVTVGNASFYTCSALVVADFPAATALDVGSFSFCISLVTLNFPLVTDIPHQCFANCSSITDVNHTQFPLVTTMSGGIQFSDCTSLVNFTLTNLVGNLGDTGVGGTFLNCSSLVTISLPLITFIGSNGFQDCSALQSVDFPLVTEVENTCFNSCVAIITIDLPECVTIGSTTGDNGVFGSISGNTITLTVKLAASTDGDVVTLQANNTVTLITT